MQNKNPGVKQFKILAVKFLGPEPLRILYSYQIENKLLDIQQHLRGEMYKNV